MATLRPTSYTAPGAILDTPSYAYDADPGTECRQYASAAGTYTGTLSGYPGGSTGAATISIRARSSVYGTCTAQVTVRVSGVAKKTWDLVSAASLTTFSYDLGTVDPANVTVTVVNTQTDIYNRSSVYIADAALEFAGDPSLASTATRTLSATAALTAASTLGGAAPRLQTGQGGMVAPSSLASASARSITATGTISGNGLSSVAARIIAATGALSAPVCLGTVAARVIAPSAALSSPCSLAAVATRVISGTGTLDRGGYYLPNPTLQGRRIARDLQIPFQGERVS